MPSSPSTNRLVTIPISHFCEKARWALDRARVPYTEEKHLQAIHIAFAFRAGGGRTVPVLVTAEGEVYPESAAILRWADTQVDDGDRLYPNGPVGVEAARVEAWLDGGLGPDGRLWLYETTLPSMAALQRWIVDGTPAWEQRMFGVGRKAVGVFIRRYLDVSPANAAAAMTRVTRTFDEVAEILRDGRPYLCGERFTAADLTFGALSASVLVPDAYGSPLPPIDLMPAAATAEIRRLRAHEAGRFAARLYAERRHHP